MIHYLSTLMNILKIIFQIIGYILLAIWIFQRFNWWDDPIWTVLICIWLLLTMANPWPFASLPISIIILYLIWTALFEYPVVIIYICIAMVILFSMFKIASLESKLWEAENRNLELRKINQELIDKENLVKEKKMKQKVTKRAS